jgi:hypothetical protein
MISSTQRSPDVARALQDPLPGVPRVESPFFDRFFGNGLVDPETYRIARDLNENGFAVIDFPDPEFDARAELIRANLTARYDWETWRANPSSGLRIQDAWTFDENVRRLAANEQILALLTTLYGREAWPFQTLNFPVGTQQHFHTDSVHFSSIPERFMCGVWVALEDIDADSGPLFYYPGSHKWPIYVNEHIGHLAAGTTTTQGVYEGLWRELVELHDIKPERLVVKKGSALIWAANLLHGGDRRKDLARTRWSQVSHYFFDDCAYYTPMESDPAIGSTRFRELQDIATGKLRPNMYLGRRIPENVLFGRQEEPLPFDPAAYLAANPDVASSGMDPWLHWTRYGRQERRRLRPLGLD